MGSEAVGLCGQNHQFSCKQKHASLIVTQKKKTRLPHLFFHSLKGTSKPNSFSSLQNRGPILSHLSLSLFAKLQIHFYRIETEYKTHYQKSEILERERGQEKERSWPLYFISFLFSFVFTWWWWWLFCHGKWQSIYANSAWDSRGYR